MPANPVVNIDDLELKSHSNGENFEASFGTMTPDSGAKHLGARLTVLPSGKRAWPHHNHHGNDEMFVILAGEGELRFGDDRFPLREGDVATCPAGGRETAHQIINTGSVELKYLAISSMRDPDITEYPDSNKLGAIAGSAPGGDPKDRTITSFIKPEEVDYWDGEE